MRVVVRALLAIVIGAIVVLGVVRPAAADDATKAASRAFAAGQAADKQGKYREAIEHYLKAYELKPHPFALYNIGIDYERLGQYREAAAWFGRYLNESQPGPEYDKVQKLLVELKLRPSTLTVTTNVPGVRVFVDGQYAGSTPFSKPVKGGGRRIRVELEGEKDERDIYLEYGEPKEIEFTLRTVAPKRGPRGTIVVQGAPDGASVSVDGQDIGSLPLARVDVIPGEHIVTATRYGYNAWTSTVRVDDNQVLPVQVLMTREGEAPAIPGQPPPPPMIAGYMIGIGGGADARGNGGVFMIDFGARYQRYDGSFRYGKIGPTYAIDFIVRVALLNKKLTPYAGGGLGYLGPGTDSIGGEGGGFGISAVGGLRWDIASGETGTATLLLELGIRKHPEIMVPDPDNSSRIITIDGLVLPLMASIQYTYGRRR